MEHFTKEQMQAARKADLYDFLMRNHASSFKREGRSIHPIDNKSLSIKQGYSGYMDFATDEKGNSVDFLVKHLGYEMDQAVFALCGTGASVSSAPKAPAPVENLPVEFPEPADGSYKNLFAFLRGRGIPTDTIQMLVDSKLLYQSKDKNNAVFINKERDWAELRGTYTLAEKQFHGVVPNCRHDGFWWFRTSKDAKIAYVCEAAIDAISLYVLHKSQGNMDDAYYISIGGAAKQSAIDRVKKSMRTVIAVDNDPAGSDCRKRNVECECIIPTHKDWNEDLQAKNTL